MKKKILLHNIQYTIGGPKTVLNGIMNSYLKEKYDFVFINQSEGCGFNPVKAISFIYKYKRLIDAERADVIYICGLQYVGLLMTIAARLSNVKRICLSVHGSEWDFPKKTFRKWLLMYLVEPIEIFLADAVFTVCDSAQQSIKALKFAKKGSNKGVVYNTFPNFDYDKIQKGKLRTELKIASDKLIVVVVGRVVKDKGHDNIIEVISENFDDRFVYIIVGDGDYINEYKHKCQKEINEGKLFLLGARNDIKEILIDSDIFLFATYHENHSIALLEAVNMKCTALVTNVGGNPEIIENGVSGYVIPARDSNAIINGLQKLCDKAIRNQFAESAYLYAKQKFSIENTYGKLDNIFES